MLSGFSREPDYLRCQLAPRRARGTVAFQASPVDFLPRLYLRAQRPIPSVARSVTLFRLPHLSERVTECYRLSWGRPCGWPLGRLTLIRISVDCSEPWSYGGRVLALLIVTLYLHCFSVTQQKLAPASTARECSLPSRHTPASTVSAADLCRLLSMRNHSTS